MELKNKVFNFLGDSITEGYGTTGSEKTFHQLLKEKYGLKAAWNYGISGTRIARQTVPSTENIRHDLDFVLRVPGMDRTADAVVVFGGTNDYGHGDAAFGTLDSTDVYTFCGAVNVLVETLKQNFPSAKLIFMTPLHRLCEENPSQSDGKTLADYVEALRAIYKKHGVFVIDLFEINPLDPANFSFLPDGLHPNDEGHRILAELIAEKLLEL